MTAQITALLLLMLTFAQARAQFLDFSQPARATAMGGNLVALPEGPSAMAFNPAGLGLQQKFQASARYEDLFSGLENDSISTGNLTFEAPLAPLGNLGLSWDHLGANQLEQDNIRLGWGTEVKQEVFHSLQIGFTASYLMQRYVLSVPLTGVSPNNVSAGSVALGAGVLISPVTDLTLGVSGDDLNQPNLGVVGTDRIPVLARWGAAFQLFSHDPIRLNMTAAQSLLNGQLDNQGGLEIYFADYGIRLRGGADNYQASIGFGYEWSDLMIDYAYVFSAFGDQELSGVGLPNSNLLELGLRWGGEPSGVDYAGYLRKAEAAERSKNWGWAAWYYQEALGLKPKDPTALEGRKRNLALYNQQRGAKFYADGQTAEKAGSFKEAQFDYEMAQKLDPTQTLYAQAQARVIQLAQPKVTPTPTPDMGLPDALDKLTVAVSANDRSAAKKILAEALKKYPNDPSLALAQKMMAHWSAAKAEPVKASKKVQLLEEEADLYMAKGRPDLAKASLQEALKDQPSNNAIQKKLSQLDNAPPTVPQETAKEAEALYEKGLQCYLAGDLNGAIANWEACLKIDPDHMNAKNNLVRAKVEKEAKTP